MHETVTPLLGYQPIRSRRPARRRCSDPPIDVSGFRLVDSRASYGVGLETFALGFPIHFDWSWRTLFNKDWEDLVYAYPGAEDGVHERQPLAAEGQVLLWIGYDF